MLFIISLVIAFAFSYLFRKPLKKHATLFYIGTVIISAVLALVDIKSVPKWADHYVFDLFRRGTLGTALFVVVMDMATFKKGSKAMRAFMPIRGELSILASILCLCHNVFFGLTYFVMMFTEPQADYADIEQERSVFACGSIPCRLADTGVLLFHSIRRPDCQYMCGWQNSCKITAGC